MRRTSVLVLAAAFCSIAIVTAEQRALRVRPAQSLAASLLNDGITHSPVFRQLVQRIEASDVIVYVEMVRTLPRGVAARVRFINATHVTRYVQIELRMGPSPEVLVELLGHELQHVMEIAGDPTVRSANDLKRLYGRIGMASGAKRESYDSQAARDVGARVRADLRRTSAG